MYNGIVGVREEAYAYFDTCINHASVTPDGRTLLTAGDAPFLYLHSLSSLPPSPFPPSSSNSATSNSSYPRPIRIGYRDSSRPLKPIHTIPTSTLSYATSEGGGWNGDDTYSEAICSTAFSEDGWKFAAGSQDGVVQVWDVRCLKKRLAMFHTMPSSLESRSFAARSAGNLSATFNNMGKTWGVRCLRFMPSSSLGHLGASTPQFGDRELLVVSQHHSTIHFVDARTFDTSPSARTSIFLPDIIKQYPTSLYSSPPPVPNWSQITEADAPLSRKRKRVDSDGSDTEVERKRREILEAEPIGSSVSSLRETLAHNLEHDASLRSYADEMEDTNFLPEPTFGVGGDTAPSSVLMPSPRSAISVFDSPIEAPSMPIVSFDGPVTSTSDAGESNSSIRAVENASSTLDGNTVGATVGESQNTTESPEPDQYQTPQPLPDDVQIGGQHNSGDLEGQERGELENDLSRRTDEVMESSGQLARRLRVMNSRLRDLVTGEPETNGNPGPSTLATRRTVPSHLSSARSVRHSPYRYPRASSSNLASSLHRQDRSARLGDGAEPSLPRMPTRDRVETLRQERGFFALQDLAPLDRQDEMALYEEDEGGDGFAPQQGSSSGRRDAPSFARDLTRGVMSQWSADSSLDPVISAGHAARRARWRQVARNRAAREVEEQLLLAAMAANMDEESDNWTQILEELPAGGIHDLTAISDHSEMDVEVETGSGEETIDAEDVPETSAGRLREALGFNEPATSGSANWGESEDLWHSSQSRAGEWESWPLRLPSTSPLPPNPTVRRSNIRGLDPSIVNQSSELPIYPRALGLGSLSSLRELNRRSTHLPSAYHTPTEPSNGVASSSNAIPVLSSTLTVPETNAPLFTASPEPMTTTVGSPLLLPRGLSELRGPRRTRIFSPFPATSPSANLNSGKCIFNSFTKSAKT
ncbi:hypothetical protein CPB86DRAFT_86347 [Serendipita vermifera]|nr:hypothetical protein CPB86DRAFT_86347 [Serendipita vermifera]